MISAACERTLKRLMLEVKLEVGSVSGSKVEVLGSLPDDEWKALDVALTAVSPVTHMWLPCELSGKVAWIGGAQHKVRAFVLFLLPCYP